jgi:hypothetical protein
VVVFGANEDGKALRAWERVGTIHANRIEPPIVEHGQELGPAEHSRRIIQAADPKIAEPAIEIGGGPQQLA